LIRLAAGPGDTWPEELRRPPWSLLSLPHRASKQFRLPYEINRLSNGKSDGMPKNIT
jgi:hypothetical protein